MVRILTIDQGSDEWKEIRRNLITATDAPIIIGESPWSTEEELLERKVSGKEIPISSAMQRGITLEPVVRRLIEFKLEKDFHPVFGICDEGWRAASLDGLSVDRIAIEIKCPGIAAHAMAIDGVVPKHYLPQLCHQMTVFDLEWMYYVSYSDRVDPDLQIIKVNQDLSMSKDLKKKELDFFKKLQEKTNAEKRKADTSHPG